MHCVALLACLVGIPPAPPGGVPLVGRVTSYWNALQRGRLDEAADLVDPAARSRFPGRRTFSVTGWKLESIEAEPVRARVTLKVEFGALAGMAALPGRVVQSWKRIDGEWYLEVPQSTPAELNQMIYGSPGHPGVGSGALSAQPPRLALHFLNPVQRGMVTLSNGLEAGAVLKSCSASVEDLSVRSQFDRLAPGQSGSVTVEVEGRTNEKNRSAKVHCLFVVGKRTISVEVPVLFNYISPEEQAFFGLTDEQVRTLRRKDRVEPKVKPPD